MLVGHEKIFSRLKELALGGRLSHAELFIGPEHTGKTKIALLLSVLLQGVEENVILKKQIYEGVNGDTLLFLDDGENLPIETVRQIVERAHQSHVLPHLIFVIENVGRMKAEAINTLLKIVEEPHEGTIFFLTANNEEDVLPTLRSRCTVTFFQTVSDALLKEMCGENVYAEQLIYFAMGRPGKLRRLLDDNEYFKAHQDILQDLAVFLEDPTTARAFELSRRYEPHPLAQEMLDILLRRAHSLARSFRLPPSAVEAVETTKVDLENNVNRKLLLENLLLTFAQ